MAVLHQHLPVKVWMDPHGARLPGIRPLPADQWLQVDEAYAGQMAEKGRLIRTQVHRVHALLPLALAAAQELLNKVLADCPGVGFERRGAWVNCPDGRTVSPRMEAPLLSLGQMMQEDFCILQPGSDGHHVLTGALLCFPASWTLSEKIGRGLPGIHQPVASYDPQVTRRVQRLFDAIRPDAPLWRANALAYAQPDLFHPRPEADQRPPFSPEPGGPQGYLRAERQVLMRLPVTRAVVFAIRTYVAPRESLSETEETAFRAWQESHRSGPGSGPQTGQSVSN
tara:strand:+ start:8971 stop:9816 length:846 start_codon:yes stop_codon:yes gene_type:complete